MQKSCGRLHTQLFAFILTLLLSGALSTKFDIKQGIRRRLSDFEEDFSLSNDNTDNISLVQSVDILAKHPLVVLRVLVSTTALLCLISTCALSIDTSRLLEKKIFGIIALTRWIDILPTSPRDSAINSPFWTSESIIQTHKELKFLSVCPDAQTWVYSFLCLANGPPSHALRAIVIRDLPYLFRFLLVYSKRVSLNQSGVCALLSWFDAQTKSELFRELAFDLASLICEALCLLPYALVNPRQPTTSSHVGSFLFKGRRIATKIVIMQYFRLRLISLSVVPQLITNHSWKRVLGGLATSSPHPKNTNMKRKRGARRRRKKKW
jgi:hypothetical protein